jgi:nucleoside-diphosphate-sugar epimerase
MRVLVTGGAGFFGGWICRQLLDEGFDIRIFDAAEDRTRLRQIVGAKADKLDWQVGDIGEPADVERAFDSCGAVIHLAAVLTPVCKADPVKAARINVIGTLNVFLAARKHGIDNVIYTSSGGIYPPSGRSLEPESHYGTFKLANEGAARSFYADDGVSSTGFRPFVVYGFGRESGLSADPSLACRAAARKENYEMKFSGPVGMVHAGDAALAYLAALKNKSKGARVFDMPGELTTMDKVASTIEALAPGVRITVSGVPLPSAALEDQSGMIAALKLQAPTPMKEGLRKTIEAYAKA